MIDKLRTTEINALKQEELESLICKYQKGDNSLLSLVYLLYQEYDTISDEKEILINKLNKYEKALEAFTKINIAFFHKFSKGEKKDKESMYTYVHSSSIHISKLQNLYIYPLIFKIHQFENDAIQVKAEASVTQGKILITEAKKSSVFAKITFVIALALSIGSIVISKISSTNSESVLNQNTETIDNIMVELDSIKASSFFNKKISNERNNIIQQKLDAILKKK